MMKWNAFTLLLLCVLLLGSVAQAQLVVDSSDFNYTWGVNSSFLQKDNYFMDVHGILPFDSNQTHWDFTALSSTQHATVQVVDPSPQPYSSYYPGATGCSISTINGATSYMYEGVTASSLHWKGWYQFAGGFHVVGDYTPDIEAYHFPMQVGVSWSSTSIYNQDWGPGTLQVPTTEMHNSQVVAEGWVKTPHTPYWAQCLVIRTYHSYSDSFGNVDNYWLYEWVVPNGFSGGNGVVACMSHVGANQDYSYCRHVLVLETSNVTPDLPLMADADTLSVSGGTVNFALDASPANAGRYYVILGSLSGTTPGIPLPDGGEILPVKWDAFTDLVLQNLNSGTFQGFLGVLNGSGLAAAQISVTTLNPSKIGKVMTYAYCLQGLPDWDFASNPVEVEFVP